MTQNRLSKPAFVRAIATGALFFIFTTGSATVEIAGSQEPRAIEVTECVVRFAEEVDVPALESGRVAEVVANLNEPIESMALIARLDDRSLKIRRHASSLRLEEARDEANDDLELRYAETALAVAEDELDSNLSTNRDVSGSVSMSHLRRLRLAVKHGELEVALAKKGRGEAHVELQLREADLAMLDDQLANLQITSPLSGTVIEVTRSAGEWIEKGHSLATVARIDRLHVHALVREDQLPPRTCKGLPVSVHWTDSSLGSERMLRGHVLSADPQVLPGARYRIHAEIVNQRDAADPTRWILVPGTTVRMKVELVKRNP
ncbi:HlyD family secretion protein [Novipirellula artificiosorum]|uniref:Multidrug resistance protein MdtN n=1 Tax=Novipirellula artificiosorum TaxID=2528016 RepID=A0A5C6DWK7_9BACT|nr:HlyD family efflux transporter periplasmic adaptor subunit [Novipirellula artificiosorum]TWU40755.1 multidrug resistance protein MdtN [Novipirellula artificiosorum]